MTRSAPSRDSLLTDGGRRTPGVPDASDDDERPDPSDDEAATPEPESTTRETTASGRTMPGVPRTGSGGESEDEGRTGPETSGGGGQHSSGGHHEPEAEHELTTAISLRALRRTETPGAVVADARTWSDWVGVVAEASGPELNAFFRSHSVDVDFFNDVSDGPAERLAAIEEGHHFYSPRRVLVGLPEEAEWAERAGWEFQPFEETAESAGWTLAEE